MASNERRRGDKSIWSIGRDSESETQEEKNSAQSGYRSASRHDCRFFAEDDSESSDSDSEVTMVRGDAPPTQPITQI